VASDYELAIEMSEALEHIAACLDYARELSEVETAA